MPQNTSPSGSELSRKALYNHLRLQAQDSDESLEPWQIEDYRKWPLEKLFQELRHLGWQLDRSSFCAYSESVDDPESLLELLLGEESIDPLDEDRLYLIIFELYRRLIPHATQIEFLCDELDYQIQAYELDEQVDSKIESILQKVIQTLEEQTDSEEEAREAFAMIATSCAQDIELFFYDFILDQLEAGALTYAQELYSCLIPLVQNPLWYNFLKVRWSNNEEATDLLKQMYQELKRDPDPDLLFEIVGYLSELEVGEEFRPFFELLATQPLEDEEKADLEEFLQVYLSHHEELSPMRKQLLQLLRQRC